MRITVTLKMSQRLESLLLEIRDMLKRLDQKLDRLEVRFFAPSHRFVPGTLMSLPEHLRRSMETIVTLGEATAHDVAEKTERSRAAESDYLNQLVDRGFLKKEKNGKEIVFQVFDLHTICPMCGDRVLITTKFCSRCGTALYGLEL